MRWLKLAAVAALFSVDAFAQDASGERRPSFDDKAIALIDTFEGACIDTDLNVDAIKQYADANGWEENTSPEVRAKGRLYWDSGIDSKAPLHLALVPMNSARRRGVGCLVQVIGNGDSETYETNHAEAVHLIRMLRERPYATDLHWTNPGKFAIREGYEDNGNGIILTMRPNNYDDLAVAYGVTESENYTLHFLGAAPRWWLEEHRPNFY